MPESWTESRPESRHWLVNCSIMFGEHDLLDRPAAARAAGFDAVEFWWPFAQPVPDDRQVETFVAAIRNSGTRLVGLNLFAGDLAGADCGVLSLPGRSAELGASLDVAASIGARLGVQVFNAVYGNRVDTATAEQQDALAQENLALAAAAVGRFGATVLVEPLSGRPAYPLRTAADAACVVRRARDSGITNVGMLCDVYHLLANGDDPVAAIGRHRDLIDHVQVADHPGRGEPGSGVLDLPGCLGALDRIGYDGWISLEYLPTTGTADSLGWLAALP